MTRSRAPLVLAAIVLILPVAPRAWGQPAPDAAGAAAVVMRQLDAFRRDDFDTAYTFASAMIRDRFDRRAFEDMVRSGYPEIARSASAVVSESATAPDGTVFLRIRIRGANGNRIEALYEMVREEGRWVVNGVVARPDSSESV